MPCSGMNLTSSRTEIDGEASFVEESVAVTVHVSGGV